MRRNESKQPKVVMLFSRINGRHTLYVDPSFARKDEKTQIVRGYTPGKRINAAVEYTYSVN